MTVVDAAKEFTVRLGMFFRVLGREMQPAYWVCNSCGSIEYRFDNSDICWKCGGNKMIYKGDLYDRDNNSRAKRST